MRYIFAILILVFAGATIAGANSVTVTGRHNGKELTFSPEEREQIVIHSLKLLQTSSYEADESIATEERIMRVRDGSNIHIIFSEPKIIGVRVSTTGPATDKDVTIQDILIPASTTNWPDYIFVRERNKIRAFSKYNHVPALALRDILKRNNEPNQRFEGTGDPQAARQPPQP